MKGAGKLFLLALQANHHLTSPFARVSPRALTSCPPVQNLINPCICVSYIDILKDKKETAMQSLQV